MSKHPEEKRAPMGTSEPTCANAREFRTAPVEETVIFVDDPVLRERAQETIRLIKEHLPGV